MHTILIKTYCLTFLKLNTMLKMLKIILVFFVLINSCYCYSQSKVDSLLSLFQQETNPDIRIDLSYKIARLTLRNQPDICKEVIYSAISDSNIISDKYMLGKNLNYLGIVYQYQAIYDSADYYFNRCLKIAKQITNMQLEMFAYNNLAINFKNNGDYEDAINYFIKVLEEEEKRDNKERIAAVLNDIGNTYLYMNNFEMGIEYQRKALKIIEQVDTITNSAISIKANTLNSIGYTYNALEINDSALHYYEKSLVLKKQINNLYSWCNTKLNLCNLLPWDSYEYVLCNQELLEVQKQINDRRGIVETRINLALSYSEMGDVKKSLNDNFDILNNYSDLCDDKMLGQLHKNIAGDYYLLGDFKSAYDYRIYYDHFQDSIRNKIYSSDILEITEKYQSERKDREITAQNLEIVNAKLRISETELRVSNKNKLIYLLLGGGLTLLFFGLFIIQRNKRKAQQEKDKAIITEQEKGLIAVFNAQEEERGRVAKDLHDGIGQQISAVNLNFQALAKKIVSISDDFKPDINKIKKMIADTGTDVRSISHQMMPRALTKYGLIDALEDMIDSSFVNSKIKCEFEYFNMDKRLPQNIEIGLYRIAQELVSNIFRHSQAQKVNIQLVKKENHCILIVQDDGRGIEDKNTDGIGIRNMNSRLSAMNGELNLESDSHSGTTAIVKIRL